MNEKYGAVLVVDDNEDVLVAARIFLKQYVETVHTESDPERITELLGRRHFDVVLLDMNFTRDVTSGEEGFYWLHRIQEIDPAAIVIFITAYADVDMAVRAMKEGAVDFIVKPWQNEKLLATVSAALTLGRSRREVESLRSRERRLSEDLDQPFHDFIGRSQPMQDVFESIRKVAVTDANVLITGENGTGKELVARSIHRQSPRADGPFVKVDMGALSGTLFESELFGHVKGAFTDAKFDREGLFARAAGGTVFLDEVDKTSRNFQDKLLRVVDKREFKPVGSSTAQQADFRIVCATNKDLAREVEGGAFLPDLYYRLKVICLKLPPLRERREDIPLLAVHFLEKYCRRLGKRVSAFAPEAMELMVSYRWPGNVRQLEHEVERVVAFAGDDDQVSPEDLSEELRSWGAVIRVTEARALAEAVEQVERRMITECLKRHAGNRTRVAASLGLSRRGLLNKIKRYHLEDGVSVK